MKQWVYVSGRRAWGLAAAFVLVATGSIVLVRAQGHASEASLPPTALGSFDLSATAPTSNGTGAATPSGNQQSFARSGLTGSVALTHGAVLRGGSRQVFAELRLAAEGAADESRRRPVALSIVLDTSGSMTGEKLEEARRAVLGLVNGMADDDWISFIVYSDTPRVIQRSAPLSQSRLRLRGAVRSIRANGGTNIPQALVLGAGSLDAAPETHVRRVVLLSDGRDHSGMNGPQLQRLITDFANRGTTFSSLGVGTDYSEPFMTRVADAGRGNYAFLERGSELSGFLRRELNQAGATVAENIQVDFRLPSGVRVARGYGVEVDGHEGQVTIPIGSLSAGERRRAFVAFDVDTNRVTDDVSLAVDVVFRNARTRDQQEFSAGVLALRVVDDENQVAASTNVATHADALSTVIDTAQASSVEAYRSGNRSGAIVQTQRNIGALQAQQARNYSSARATQIREFRQDIANFESNDAQSQQGRAGGLLSNDRRRARSRGW